MHIQQEPNFLDPEVHQELYEVFEYLRAHQPVYYCQKSLQYLITRYEDVKTLCADPRLSADRRELTRVRSTEAGLDLPFYDRNSGHQMLFMDGERHRSLRRPCQHSFNQTRPLWDKAVRRIAGQLLEPIIASGQLDLVKDFSQSLSALVIAELLGVPESDRPFFKLHADRVALYFGSPLRNFEEAGIAANESSRLIWDYFDELFEQRLREPAEDMLSELVKVYQAGRLSKDDCLGNLILTLNAGHLTVTDQLPNAVHQVLAHPAQHAALQADTELYRTAADEALRFDTSVPVIHRIAKESLDVAGQNIPAGSVVALCLASANHDEAVFDNPKSFDVARNPNPHLAFGSSHHLCLGSTLARLELSVALQVLLEKLPALRIDPVSLATPKRESLVFRGWEAMPLVFDADSIRGGGQSALHYG
jgi:pimeloyl-[acyl-carrier protein] synthase